MCDATRRTLPFRSQAALADGVDRANTPCRQAARARGREPDPRNVTVEPCRGWWIALCRGLRARVGRDADRELVRHPGRRRRPWNSILTLPLGVRVVVGRGGRVLAPSTAGHPCECRFRVRPAPSSPLPGYVSLRALGPPSTAETPPPSRTSPSIPEAQAPRLAPRHAPDAGSLTRAGSVRCRRLLQARRHVHRIPGANPPLRPSPPARC